MKVTVLAESSTFPIFAILCLNTSKTVSRLVNFLTALAGNCKPKGLIGRAFAVPMRIEHRDQASSLCSTTVSSMHLHVSLVSLLSPLFSHFLGYLTFPGFTFHIMFNSNFSLARTLQVNKNT